MRHAIKLAVLLPVALMLGAADKPMKTAQELNASGVNLMSNIANWQETNAFWRIVSRSNYFKSLLSRQQQYTLFAVDHAALEKIWPVARINGIRGRSRGPNEADRVTGGHLVPGVVTAAALSQRIKDGRGTATLTTVSGVVLTARERDGRILLSAPDGAMATVIVADLRSTNGVVHIVDAMLVE